MMLVMKVILKTIMILFNFLLIPYIGDNKKLEEHKTGVLGFILLELIVMVIFIWKKTN